MADTSLQKPVEKTRLRLALESDFFYQFKKSPVAVVSAIVVVLMMLAAIFAPLIAPYNPFDPASLYRFCP